MDGLSVYWRPGCSSCVKVKEFLAELGVPYRSVNVSAAPAAMDELAALGVRSVPVVTRGSEYVFAQSLEDVARFVGRELRAARLPAPELMSKWRTVLEAARRHVAQLPAARLGERAVEGRDRSLLALAWHVWQIPDAFLQAVEDGVEDLAAVYNSPPPQEVTGIEDLRRYGASVEKRLARWSAEPAWPSTVRTYYGERPLDELLERCAWHSAQHARQLEAVLERLGIAPERPLTAADYAGLPMPKGLWE